MGYHQQSVANDRLSTPDVGLASTSSRSDLRSGTREKIAEGVSSRSTGSTKGHGQSTRAEYPHRTEEQSKKLRSFLSSIHVTEESTNQSLINKLMARGKPDAWEFAKREFGVNMTELVRHRSERVSLPEVRKHREQSPETARVGNSSERTPEQSKKLQSFLRDDGITEKSKNQELINKLVARGKPDAWEFAKREFGLSMTELARHRSERVSLPEAPRSDGGEAQDQSPNGADRERGTHPNREGLLSLQDFKKKYLGVKYKLYCDPDSTKVVDCVTLVWHYLKDCKGVDCSKLAARHCRVKDGHDLMYTVGDKKMCTVSVHSGALKSNASNGMEGVKVGDVVLLGCSDHNTKIGFSAQHLAIVTGVKRDDEGRVVDLKIMHAAYKSVVREESLLGFLARKQESARARTRDLFKSAQVWSVDGAKGRGLMS